MRAFVMLLVVGLVWAPPVPREAPGWDRMPRAAPTAVAVYRAPAPTPVPVPAATQVAPRQVVVAVIDTGVDCNHPSLVNRCVEGRSFVNGVSNDVAVDVVGHGTQVAGVIAARSPGALIMPIRLADWHHAGFIPADIAAAIRWAATNGAQIINLSLGSGTDHQVVSESIADACWRGVTIIAAAGNHGNDRKMYPAAYPCVIAVGALDGTGARAQTDTWASGYGPHVQVWRYGVEIETVTPTYDVGMGLPLTHGVFSGTSAAAAVFSSEMANR